MALHGVRCCSVHVTKGKGGWLVAGGVVSAGCESQLQV